MIKSTSVTLICNKFLAWLTTIFGQFYPTWTTLTFYTPTLVLIMWILLISATPWISAAIVCFTKLGELQNQFFFQHCTSSSTEINIHFFVLKSYYNPLNPFLFVGPHRIALLKTLIMSKHYKNTPSYDEFEYNKKGWWHQRLFFPINTNWACWSAICKTEVLNTNSIW